VKDGEAGMDYAEVQFDKLVSTALNEGLDAIDIFCVLIHARILGKEKEFCMRDSTERRGVIQFVFV
jgi:hypothetical protein